MNWSQKAMRFLTERLKYMTARLTGDTVNRGLIIFSRITTNTDPHDSLDLATPFEYYQYLKKKTRLSHRYFTRTGDAKAYKHGV